MRRLAVIGGGVSGLIVAFRRATAGDDVVLFEASERLGGQLHSLRASGFVVELGAEGFVATSSAVPALAADLGIGEQVLDQSVTHSLGFDGEALRVLAPGEAAEFLGFQVARGELGRGVRSFAGGMQSLTDALVRATSGRAELRAGAAVAELGWTGECWRVALSEGAGDERFDAIVIATPAADAARLLARELGTTAVALAAARTASSVTVSLAFRQSDLGHPLDATGFVIATERQQQGCRACTFASSKFAGRAPAGQALVRLFFRPQGDDLARCSDEEWSERALGQLARVIPVRARPSQSWVSRWRDALPVFGSEHQSHVLAVETALKPKQAWLTGSAFHGSGIDAAVRSAELAAKA